MKRRKEKEKKTKEENKKKDKDENVEDAGEEGAEKKERDDKVSIIFLRPQSPIYRGESPSAGACHSLSILLAWTTESWDLCTFW